MTGTLSSLLGEAVRQRRRQLRLTQDLTDLGGPGAMTIRKIEQGDTSELRGHTRKRLEQALSWPPGYVDRVLAGEAEELPEPDIRSTDVRNLDTLAAAGTLVTALATMERTPAAERVLDALLAWLPELGA